MPKVEFVYEGRSPVPDEMKSTLTRYFSQADIAKLERLGGRVTISISAPYVSPQQRAASRSISVDASLLEDLQRVRGDYEEVTRILASLNAKQLKKLCSIAAVPVRSSSTAGQLRSVLSHAIQAEDIWRRISDATKKSDLP